MFLTHLWAVSASCYCLHLLSFTDLVIGSFDQEWKEELLALWSCLYTGVKRPVEFLTKRSYEMASTLPPGNLVPECVQVQHKYMDITKIELPNSLNTSCDIIKET